MTNGTARRSFAGLLAFGVITLVALPPATDAQDRLKSMPGYAQYQKISGESVGSVKGGTLTFTWRDGGKVFDYRKDGKVYRYDIASRKTEIVGERDTPNGRSMYMARPMIIKEEACLFCHDTAERAPRTMIDRYGTANGFGWKVNDVTLTGSAAESATTNRTTTSPRAWPLGSRSTLRKPSIAAS